MEEEQRRNKMKRSLHKNAEYDGNPVTNALSDIYPSLVTLSCLSALQAVMEALLM